jgi:hypothetical protein
MFLISEINFMLVFSVLSHWITLHRLALHQWFLTCDTRTPGGTRQTSSGYAEIILVMAENTKKGVKIKTQKQSQEVLVYKERLM